MNDRLSLTSLILVGKVTGDKVVFIRVLVFVLDRTSQSESLLTSSEINQNLHKNSWDSQDENVAPIS